MPQGLESHKSIAASCLLCLAHVVHVRLDERAGEGKAQLEGLKLILAKERGSSKVGVDNDNLDDLLSVDDDFLLDLGGFLSAVLG